MEFDYDFEREERGAKVRKFLKKTILWIIVLGAVITAAWAITRYMLEKTNMSGDSMEITLHADDTILINKLAYVKKGPERFDIIVFTKNGKEHSYYSVKRVIGLPGETVTIEDGIIYINGETLDEPMVVDSMNIAGLAEDGITLDEDEYFVLGDNRNNSEDSRFANVGNVFSSEIIGKAWLRLNKFAIINDINMDSKDKASEEETQSKE